MLCGFYVVVVGYIQVYTAIGCPNNELATTRRQVDQIRPQLGNRPTDTRQTNRHEAKSPSDQAFIYVVGFIGLSRLFLASCTRREAMMRPQLGNRVRHKTNRHETNRHEAKRPSDQAFIYVGSWLHRAIPVSRLFL